MNRHFTFLAVVVAAALFPDFASAGSYNHGNWCAICGDSHSTASHRADLVQRVANGAKLEPVGDPVTKQMMAEARAAWLLSVSEDARKRRQGRLLVSKAELAALRVEWDGLSAEMTDPALSPRIDASATNAMRTARSAVFAASAKCSECESSFGGTTGERQDSLLAELAAMVRSARQSLDRASRYRDIAIRNESPERRPFRDTGFLKQASAFVERHVEATAAALAAFAALVLSWLISLRIRRRNNELAASFARRLSQLAKMSNGRDSDEIASALLELGRAPRSVRRRPEVAHPAAVLSRVLDERRIAEVGGESDE